MKTGFPLLAVSAVVSLTLLFFNLSQAQNLRLLSEADPSQVPSGASGDSWVFAMSPDGRYVLFARTANNLLLMSNGLPMPLGLPANLNVYMRDRLQGTNALVSVNVSGVAGGDANSLPAAISADGRYVAFESDASDLVPHDSNYSGDVFVRDVLSNATMLVSTALNGGVGNGASWSPAITHDGPLRRLCERGR